MMYLGDFNVGQIVLIPFNTFTSNDPAASSTITNFVNTDVHIHKDDSLTQRNNAAGVSIDIDIDGITGSHFIKIDMADNTVVDFFEAGHDYYARIEGTTVDAGTVNAVVACWSVKNRAVAGHMATSSITTLATQVSFTLNAGEASGDDDAYNNCTAIITDQTTMVQKAIGLISDYTGSTRTVTLAADPGIFTMAVGDSVEIIATSALANVAAVTGTAQTAGDLADLITTVDTVVDAIPTTAMRGTDSAATAVALATAQTDLDTITGASGVVIATAENNAIADAILTRQMTESYAANGVAPTLAQAQLAVHQMLMQFGIASTSITVRKLDDSTTAFVVTLDSSTSPTDAKRV